MMRRAKISSGVRKRWGPLGNPVGDLGAADIVNRRNTTSGGGGGGVVCGGCGGGGGGGGGGLGRQDHTRRCSYGQSADNSTTTTGKGTFPKSPLRKNGGAPINKRRLLFVEMGVEGAEGETVIRREGRNVSLSPRTLQGKTPRCSGYR